MSAISAPCASSSSPSPSPPLPLPVLSSVSSAEALAAGGVRELALPELSLAAAAVAVGSRRLFLVRHAESVNNVDKRNAWAAVNGICKLQSLPSLTQLKSMAALCTVPMDTPLSDDGIRMVRAQRAILEHTRFVERYDVQLILHSHLQRAKATAIRLFSGLGNAGGQQPPIREHPLLFEKNLKEHARLTNMEKRICSVMADLLALPPAVHTVVLVAHSSFFRSFLQQKKRLDNCEIYAARLDPLRTTLQQESNLSENKEQQEEQQDDTKTKTSEVNSERNEAHSKSGTNPAGKRQHARPGNISDVRPLLLGGHELLKASQAQQHPHADNVNGSGSDNAGITRTSLTPVSLQSPEAVSAATSDLAAAPAAIGAAEIPGASVMNTANANAEKAVHQSLP